MKTTVSALYDNRQDAARAVRALRDMGVDGDAISMVSSDSAGEYTQYHGKTFPQDMPADDTAQGAASGAIVGGLGGLLVGLAALAIPGVGPIVAAGPIATALVGAGVGAATGGVVGALIDLGIDEDHVGYYAEGVRRGGTIVTATVDRSLTDQVMAVLDRSNPVNLEDRANEWREEGWTAYDPAAGPYYAEVLNPERDRPSY